MLTAEDLSEKKIHALSRMSASTRIDMITSAMRMWLEIRIVLFVVIVVVALLC